MRKLWLSFCFVLSMQAASASPLFVKDQHDNWYQVLDAGKLVVTVKPAEVPWSIKHPKLTAAGRSARNKARFFNPIVIFLGSCAQVAKAFY